MNSNTVLSQVNIGCFMVRGHIDQLHKCRPLELSWVPRYLTLWMGLARWKGLPVISINVEKQNLQPINSMLGQTRE